MSLLQPFSSIPRTPSLASKLCGPALMVGAAAVLIGAGFAMGASAGPGVIEVPVPARMSDPCSVPDGMTLQTLDARDRVHLMRRVLACRDRVHGWMTAEQYMKTVGAIDESWTSGPAKPVTVVEPVVTQPIWATSVRGFSTQYSADAWSAKKVLGAPDVFPGTGDNENAWASEGADDRAEWLEVGFAQPRSISAVQIYETFNPGAVGRIELVTTTGRRIEVRVARSSSTSNDSEAGDESLLSVAPMACTSEPIAAVRVHVDSKAVEGWNEIDAIGVVPCQ